MIKFRFLFLQTLFVLATLGLSAQTNLLSNWNAGTLTGNGSKPTDIGWLCTPNGTLPWSQANASGGTRFLDYNISGGHTGFLFNATTLTSRIMYIRWDSGNAASYFTYPVTLTACKNYTFTWKYSLAANGTASTITAAVCTSSDGKTGTFAKKDFVCSTTLKTFLESSFTFTPPTSGKYYLSFISSTPSMDAIADLSLVENSTKGLTVSSSTLSFDVLNTSRKFSIRGNSLTDSVKLTAPTGISLSKTGFTGAEVQCGVEVVAIHDGSIALKNAAIGIQSGAGFSKIIQVSATLGDQACINPLYPDKTNLIIDPFFNDLNNFSGWGTYEIDTTPGDAFCGSSCGKITTSGSMDIALSLNPYTKYRLRAMAKTVGGTFQLGVAKYNGAAADINIVVDTQGEWSPIDINFTTGATVTDALAFFNNYQRTGTVGYIDNFELYEMGTLDGSSAEISLETLSEVAVKSTIREMLAKHLVYGESQYKSGGYFGNGQSVEHGARTNADYALVYAFLYKKGQDQSLPNGLTFETVKAHALAALRYSYNTHTANKVKLCTDNKYWGLVWESAMWSTSTAYAAWLLWPELTDADKTAIKNIVIAEANYKLSTPIPTLVNSDTKAEENGWDTNILSIASAMFPEEKNAEAWTYRCKQYAMNTYSVASDAYNKKVVDGKTVSDWHIGANLFPDYALENHNFFHTSYLNIPIQEMTESYLAYKAVQDQTNPVFPLPQALKHNVSNVWNSMLKEFILADGILAMPNGNDWSMYIFDELATYSAMATVYRDADALMLESIVLQWAKYRQSTTADGSFLLNPDVAERRMAVTARRLVFAHLYHDYFPTSDMTATSWSEFSKQHETTKYLPYSRIIRSNTKDRYTTFSWFQSADGTSYKSYMGMVSPNSPNYSNIIFPFKTTNTGNFTGYIDVSGKTRNASFLANSFAMYPQSFATTGRLAVTSSAFNKYLSFYSTPGNAVIYHEDMVGATAGTITKDGGLMLGITTDILTKMSRTLYSEDGSATTNGDAVTKLAGNWVNVDNVLGMVVEGGSGIAFGEKELSTSVYVAKLYGSYSVASKAFTNGELVFSRSAILYSGVDATTTKLLASKAKYPTVATGWKATAAEDADGRRYLLMSNFRSALSSNVTLSYSEGAPVFDKVTTISGATGTGSFNTSLNASEVNELYAFVNAGTETLKAVQGENPYSVFVKNENSSAVNVTVKIWNNGSYLSSNEIIPAAECKFIRLEDGVMVSSIAVFPEGYRNVALGKFVGANDQWPENFPFAVIDQIDSTSYKSLTLPTAANPANLTFNLSAVNACNKISIQSVANAGPRDIQIQESNNGVSFNTIGSATLLNSSDWQDVPFAETDAKYFRILITSTYGAENVSVNEVKIFGYPK